MSGHGTPIPMQAGHANPLTGTAHVPGDKSISHRSLMFGAMAVVRWAARRPPKPETWLGKMVARKPKMLVAIALANKMARGLWAMMIREEPYQRPAAT